MKHTKKLRETMKKTFVLTNTRIQEITFNYIRKGLNKMCDIL